MLYALVVAASLSMAPGTPDAAWLERRVAAQADPADEARLAIDRQLRVMEAAMLAGDKAGYLATVFKADSEFMNEQTYFANDLTKKKPEAVTLTLGEVKLTDGSAVGKLTWAWNMPGEKPREVAFDARFIESNGAWLYAGETWELHEAPGVKVLCDPGLDELASSTAEAFTSIRPGVEADFELQASALPKKIQKIKIYGSMKHLQQSICLSYKDGLGGWNEPRESIKMLAGPKSRPGQLKGVLAHEYGHVATFELGPDSNKMAWWILEGIAEQSLQNAVGGRGVDAVVQRWARNGKLAPWPELADFDTIKPQFYGHVYTQGHHMISYIGKTFGRPALNKWMTLQSNGKTMDQACTEVLGRSWDQLAAEWRAALPKEGEEEPEEPKPDAKPESKPEAKPETKPGTKAPEPSKGG